MKSSIMWHLTLGMLLICLLIYLSFAATNEFSWSGWPPGDAQTMLSLRQWTEGGWFANKFLFIPQGYAKVVRFLDEPKLRHHAHGICPATSPLVGPRLWYTHYPPGYTVPYAILHRLGLHDIFFMRMLSVLFSVGAIIMMYILFSKILTPGVSFTAVFFYAISIPFLDYADSLQNFPLDDFLRFAFMLAVVFSTRAESLKRRRIWMVSAWIIQFLVSLSSFDGVFFVYVWLIGWYFIERQGIRWKICLIYALAPLTAHFLQFLQNIWYLGLNDAILDVKGAFLSRSGGEVDYFLTMYSRFVPIFDKPYKLIILALIILLFISYARFLRHKKEKEIPSLGLLVVLFLCGLPFFLLLPGGAAMPFETKQMLPFTVALVSGCIWAFAREFKSRNYKFYNYVAEQVLSSQKKSILLYALLLFILLTGFVFIVNFNFKKSRYFVPPNNPDVMLSKAIKSVVTKYEPVIFNIDGFRWYINPNYMRGYPLIHPIIEYYVGSKPILCFTAPEALTSDLLYMIFRSPYKFSPILVASNAADIENIFSILSKNGALKNTPAKTLVMDKYVIDLTDYLRWDDIKLKIP